MTGISRGRLGFYFIILAMGIAGLVRMAGALQEVGIPVPLLLLPISCIIFIAVVIFLEFLKLEFAVDTQVGLRHSEQSVIKMVEQRVSHCEKFAEEVMVVYQAFSDAQEAFKRTETYKRTSARAMEDNS